MLRTLLISASDSDRLRRWVTRLGPTREIAYRYVAGDVLNDAITAVRALAHDGRTATIDYLGEAVTTGQEARAAADTYLRALDTIREHGLPAGVSVKPTQMGLGFDDALCAELLGRIAAAAATAGVHVTLDMEGSDVTEATVTLVEKLHGAGHRHVGCAVQAYLHRTEDDIRRLSALGASLRLCKGAYAEPEAIAWQSRADVRDAFARAADLLLHSGSYPRFATHDDVLIDRVKTAAARRGVGRDAFEFQMLYGVRPTLQAALVRDGYRLRVYVPFGEQWYRYFMRRLAERPANLVFFLRALRDR